MLTLAKWLLLLYPRAWRHRYATEFIAVLEQHQITIRTLVDIIVGALKARLTWERPGLWPFRFCVGIALLTLVALSTYTVFQQDMRLGANHPQVEMAESLAQNLQSGESLSGSLPSSVDVEKSLDPFVIVYNSTGKPVYSTGYLNGSVPELPKGVLQYTRQHHEDRITWQPRSDVRIAAVIVNYGGRDGGFVLAGRSLRVVEQQESSLLHIVGLAYLGALILFTAALWSWWRKVRKSRTTPSMH
jgi:hypothetical protein